VSFDQYYQDELAYLREMGEVFANAYPKLAPFLAQKGQDPDVERLLEGFAFMSGKIRQKLDDELPELTHNLHSLLWPNYLRPVPALSILQFAPIKNAITTRKTITKGVEIDSKPVDGTTCRFRTSYDVDIYPMSISGISHDDRGATSSIKLNIKLDSSVSFEQLNLSSLRLFLYGDMQTSFTLYQYLFRYLGSINVSHLVEKNKNTNSEKPDENGDLRASNESSESFLLPSRALNAIGFGENDELFPYPDNAFTGYRLIQDYFSLPHKFLFIDINGLDAVSRFIDSESGVNEFEIEFKFNRRLDEFVRINNDSLLLNCTPITNLFSKDADPIRLNREKTEYNVRPSSSEQTHYEVYSIDKVVGWKYGGREKINYKPFVSFDNCIDIDKTTENYYQIKIKPSVVGRGADTYASFISPGNDNELESNTVSLELTCTNRTLPEKLKVGDISVATDSSPEFATFKNIFPAAPSTPAPIEKDLHWQLISNMSLNYLSLGDVKALRVILSNYNFQAQNNRQASRAHELKMDGLVSVQQEPCTRLIKGLPVRGYKTTMAMRSGHFSSEGEMYLFASVLNEFLAMYVSINSFSQLVVNDIDKVEEYQWPIKIGNQSRL